MQKKLVLLLSVLLCFAGFGHARAQSTARLELYDLQTGTFPTLTAGLDAFDSDGNFITGLNPDAVTLMEDEQARPLAKLEDLQPGVRFALALDPGPAFAFRDAKAVTRYDKVYKVLQDWAATHSDDLGDDLSFIPTASAVSAHLSSSSAFAKALEAYSPPLSVIKPTVDTLSQALDAVTEQTARPEMKPAVLFVSSPPAADALTALQGLTQRAVDQHVRVDVWIVISTDFSKTAGATALKDLAIQTGGQYVLFSGVEPLPGLETYLAPLRHAYRLTYTSGVTTSGDHALVAQAKVNDENLASPAISFTLDIQPPNPILVSPPAQIVRQAPDDRTTETASFTPAYQAIEAIIEFPDGRTRPLTDTALYVDGQKVVENTSAPFDRFIWDLSGYSISGQHMLSVEVTDSFGLKKTSVSVPVVVTVIIPERGILPFLSRNRLWVAFGAVAFAGLALGVVLVTGRARRRNTTRSDRDARRDPLTQPVLLKRIERHIRRLPWRPSQKESRAYLVRLRDDGQSITAPPIPVTAPEMVFGSDPLHATRILDDPSVSPVHARLKEERGTFILSDERSVAGTWVNYEQINAPVRLQHGDILQFGRITYRFMLRQPPERPAPKVTPIKR